MNKPKINPAKIVVISGAGVSAPSGLATFRSDDGLWAQHRIEDVATPEGWAANPHLVLEFYNERRLAAADALRVVSSDNLTEVCDFSGIRIMTSFEFRSRYEIIPTFLRGSLRLLIAVEPSR